ncbi:hypothetical protein KKD70_03635 [Patescibacteria group bacterium]|nr:hypothetical protein [Patescibacteria group bacterium]
MKSILLKVDDKISDELKLIQKQEGLGNRTSTITYLIKYYLLTQQTSFDKTLTIFDKMLEKIDAKKLPSLKKQLKDL